MDESGWDLSMIAAVISAVAAWVAVIFAYNGARTAKKSLDLSNQQETRRRPHFVPYMAEGYSRRTPDRRLYAVSLSLSNPTDSDNSIAKIELQVRYRTRDRIVMTIRLPHDETLHEGFGRPNIQTFTVPFRVAAHDTTAGWVLFALPLSVIQDAEVDEYSVFLFDAHGIRAEIEPGILREITSDKTPDISVPDSP